MHHAGSNTDLALPTDWIDQWRGSASSAFEFEGETVSYAQFVARVDATASMLRGIGIETGDRVSWIGLNRLELFELLFACAGIGAIFNPLNNRLTASELAQQLTDADPALIVVADGFGPTITEALSSAALAVRVIDVDTSPLRDDSAAAPAGPTERRVGAHDPLLMVFTSGTTGRAKGAVLSHGAIAATIDNGIRSQGLGPDDRIIAPLPTFHVGGLNIQTLPTLVAGGTVILMRRFDPAVTLELITTHRPTQTLLVPAMLAAVAAQPGFADADLSCLRGVMSGSSVVPSAVTAPWFDRGVAIGQVYGTTETGPTAVVLGYDDAADHPGSAGRVVAPCELRIVDRHGDDVDAGVAGEIVLRGPNLLSEYWRDPEATGAALVGGWYLTGDVGHVDHDGWLYVSDRLGDMIISGGENVYPAEVEAVLVQHPQIAEIAVVGQPDERLGEVGVAVVVLADSSQGLTLADLRSWADDRLARFKHPRSLRIVDALPRTALGKVTKHVLRAELS